MPAPRGSTRHCDAVEAHGESIQELLQIVEVITADGIVSDRERRLYRQHRATVEASYAPLPRQASQQDGVLRWIGAVAGAGQVTPYVTRLTRETMEDEITTFAAD